MEKLLKEYFPTINIFFTVKTAVLTKSRILDAVNLMKHNFCREAEVSALLLINPSNTIFFYTSGRERECVCVCVYGADRYMKVQMFWF